jgi:tRNA-2-methylthio-N6-dimethylallyladenosine synthase
MAGPKKVYVKTFGCQMNVYDSERLVEALAPAGYTETSDITDADLVVLNTCHIREKAVEKVYSDLGRVRDVKAERQALGKSTLVAVTGCVAQAEGQEISRRAPVVDLVIGPQSYHRLPELLGRAGDGRRIVETEFPEADKFKALPERKGPRQTAAFLPSAGTSSAFCVSHHALA